MCLKKIRRLHFEQAFSLQSYHCIKSRPPSITAQVPTAHKVPAPIPVYQRPSKSSAQDYAQRRKSQGVDFNNLILLTKSAMKVRRNQTKASKKSFAESMRLQSSAAAAAAATAAAAVKTDAGCSARWFDKGCQPVMEMRVMMVREWVWLMALGRL